MHEGSQFRKFEGEKVGRIIMQAIVERMSVSCSVKVR